MTRTSPPIQLRFVQDCPTRPILDQVADKWSMMILTVLEEPTRFNEVKRQLQGVTQRVLTQTLRRLERSGLVERRILATSPVGVEYSLTPLGKSFREPFIQLYEWALAHSDAIKDAQQRYDNRRDLEQCGTSSARLNGPKMAGAAAAGEGTRQRELLGQNRN